MPADSTTVHIGENSPEQVAYKLMRDVANVEGKAFHKNPTGGNTAADREWILNAYADCLRAVHGHRPEQIPGFDRS